MRSGNSNNPGLNLFRQKPGVLVVIPFIELGNRGVHALTEFLCSNLGNGDTKACVRLHRLD